MCQLHLLQLPLSRRPGLLPAGVRRRLPAQHLVEPLCLCLSLFLCRLQQLSLAEPSQQVFDLGGGQAPSTQHSPH